jgi:hypothetical protein
VSIADDLVAAHAPWLTPDLETYLRAIGEMFSEVELYAILGDDDQGWVVLFDPDLAPAAALDEPHQREWIKDAPNQRRGTPLSIFQAAQRKLTGSRLVSMRERDGGNVDNLTIVTYTHETPDPAGTLQDIRDVVPHDINLTYNVLAGEDWGGVAASYATWAAVEAALPTWADVAAALSGSSTFSRPAPS